MTGKTGRQSFLLALAPGLFVLLWSTGFIGAKYGMPHAEPLTFLLLRYAAVIVLMGAAALIWRAPWPRWKQRTSVRIGKSFSSKRRRTASCRPAASIPPPAPTCMT